MFNVNIRYYNTYKKKKINYRYLSQNMSVYYNIYLYIVY